MLPVRPVRGIDAAILFSDILVTAEAMGGDLSFTQGTGPKFANPIRTKADVDKLDTEVVYKLQYVADAIKIEAPKVLLQRKHPADRFCRCAFYGDELPG